MAENIGHFPESRLMYKKAHYYHKTFDVLTGEERCGLCNDKESNPKHHGERRGFDELTEEGDVNRHYAPATHAAISR